MYNLTEAESNAFDLLIKKSFSEKRPIIASCAESFFYQIQSINESTCYFIGGIDDASQFEMITYNFNNNKWILNKDFVLNYSSEFLWDFNEDIPYSIHTTITTINNELLAKQNTLSAEVKMNYIYNFFINNFISSLSLEFNNKWHKIIEITFENQTDYTFYYLENGVIKNVIIDASIIME